MNYLMSWEEATNMVKACRMSLRSSTYDGQISVISGDGKVAGMLVMRFGLWRFVRMESMRSPKGGVSIRGVFYRGGEFIPKEVVESLSGDEIAKISGGEPGEASPGFSGQMANPAGVDTFEQYRDSSGNWTPERAAMHARIISGIMSGKTPVDRPVAYLLGGGPASGKSSAIKSGAVVYPENTVKIDPDEIKGEIPEYASMVKAKDSKAAAHVHEESSYVANKIQDTASGGGYNTLLDGTGDSSIEKLSAKIKKMKDSGQRVVANYVTCDTDLAVERAKARAAKTGRMPPESMIRKCHAEVSKIVPQAIKAGLFDEFNLWDTNESGNPRHVASAEGGKLVVHDESLWNRFLSKADQ